MAVNFAVAPSDSFSFGPFTVEVMRITGQMSGSVSCAEMLIAAKRNKRRRDAIFTSFYDTPECKGINLHLELVGIL